MNQFNFKKTHSLQHDQTDCGVACLKSIILYYGGKVTIDDLRNKSGTNIQGTTLLGLIQASNIYGLESEAFEVEDISVFNTDATFPCILHVIIEEKLEHYVVCYTPKDDKGQYLIGDPTKGIEAWSESQLLSRWKSRAMLNLKPGDKFEKCIPEKNRKWLWFKTLIKEDIPILAISSVLGIVIATLSLSTAFFTQKLIDDFLPNHKSQKLVIGLVLLLIILITKGVLSYMRSVLVIRQSKDFNSRVANSFYESLLFLPKSFFDTRKTGDLIARMNDTRRIQNTIIQISGVVFIDFFIIIISLGFVFYYSWILGLVCVFGVGLFVLLAIKFNKPIISGQSEVMTAYARTESHYIDTINGAGVIKSYNKESFFSEVTKIIFNQFQDSVFKLGQIGNKYSTFSDVLNSIFLVSILSIASLFVMNSKMKTGEMMALVSIGGGLLGSVMRIVNTNIQIQEAKVAFNRMFEFTDLKSETETLLGYKDFQAKPMVDFLKIGGG